jgi:hypothetical protein
MNRFSVWQAVQVIGEEHPRKGQAGIVHATNPAVTDEVAVKFDTDGVVLVLAVNDLKAL